MAKVARKPVNAPCKFLYKDEDGSLTLTSAAINCNRRCASCGFSRFEKVRRLREGRWIENELGLRQLIFKPREELD